MKSNFILFLLGLLLCTSAFSRTVVLTSKNHAVLSGAVDGETVAKAMVDLGKLAATNSINSTIYLVLDTPGGSVLHGNMLIDFAKALPVKIKPICLFCASMGYHIFQSLDERLVQSSSILMSHRAALSGVGGQIPGELLSKIEFYKGITEEMDRNVAKRLAIPVDVYRKMIYDELWLTGPQAIANRHADAMPNFICSGELLKDLKSEDVNTLFGTVEVFTSKCPLIQGIISFKFKRMVSYPKSDKDVINSVNKVKRQVIKEWF